ncbi:RNA 2'-phosphotransferase, partial [Streptococcus pyogenes]
IRARQGHSLSVDVDLMEKEPPSFLYHGTAERFLPDILKQGIVKKSRQFVHLSETKEVAKTVGSRHGKALVLTIEAQKLFQAGQKF